MFNTPAEYLAGTSRGSATYGKKPWERIGFITHDLFLPDWNHPVMDAAIESWEKRGVGVICSMTAVFNAHIVSRTHLLEAKTRKPLVSAIYHNVPLYLAGSMFAGSPEATIDLSTISAIRASIPRPSTRRSRAPTWPIRNTASRCSSTSATS